MKEESKPKNEAAKSEKGSYFLNLATFVIVLGAIAAFCSLIAGRESGRLIAFLAFIVGVFGGFFIWLS